MIEITSLRPKDIGRWVRYADGARVPKLGRIKGWNDHWIFVVYSCDDNWLQFQSYTGAATDPADLSFTCGVPENSNNCL